MDRKSREDKQLSADDSENQLPSGCGKFCRERRMTGHAVRPGFSAQRGPGGHQRRRIVRPEYDTWVLENPCLNTLGCDQNGDTEFEI